MNWVCPNCSNVNIDTEECEVCGALKSDFSSGSVTTAAPSVPAKKISGEKAASPVAKAEEDVSETEEDITIVYSDGSAFLAFLKRLFRPRPKKAAKPAAAVMKPSKAETTPSSPSAAEPVSVPSGSAGSCFAEPWPEHNIKFVEAEIRTKEFVSMKREEAAGKKVYAFFRSNGSKHLYTAEQAVSMGLAQRK